MLNDGQIRIRRPWADLKSFLALMLNIPTQTIENKFQPQHRAQDKIAMSVQIITK